MSGDYASAVLEDYREKKIKGAFSTNLEHPAPAKLRDECLVVYDKRYTKKDERIVRSFFDAKGDTEEAYRLAIKKIGIDKFRPLIKYLKGDINDTHEKNIELLAWLIDFQPRPYANWLKTPREEKEKITIPDTKPLPSKKPGYFSLPTVRNILSLLALIVIGALVYSFWPTNTVIDPPKHTDSSRKSQECMYWKNDHYEPASCGRSPEGTFTLPLDTFKLAHLKKITDTASINEQSVGQVWYFKSHGQLECFTAGGAYPLDTNRRLLPLTAYMIHKYIHPGRQTR